MLGATLQRLASQLPDLVPVVPAAAPVAEAVRAGAGAWPVRPIIVSGTEEKHDAFAASAAALTKSGTSTLELALANVPMLVTYRVNPLTAAIARRLVKVPYASLLNLLAGREVVPELLQENCTPDKLAATLLPLLSDARSFTHAAGMVSRRYWTAFARNGDVPSEAAADAVLSLIDGSFRPQSHDPRAGYCGLAGGDAATWLAKRRRRHFRRRHAIRALASDRRPRGGRPDRLEHHPHPALDVAEPVVAHGARHVGGDATLMVVGHAFRLVAAMEREGQLVVLAFGDSARRRCAAGAARRCSPARDSAASGRRTA